MHFSSFAYSADDAEPTPERLDAWRRRTSAPDNEIPGAIPFSALLARTEDIALALTEASAHRHGMTFTLAIRLRNGEHVRLDLFGHHGFAADQLLLGVEYPDGRTASTVGGGPHFPAPIEDDRPVLMRTGGGGGGRSYALTVWLTPLPLDGDLTVIVAWPAQGIGETRTVIPAETIAAGRAASVELWPWQPYAQQRPDPPPPPDLPAGGWFAAQVDQDSATM